MRRSRALAAVLSAALLGVGLLPASAAPAGDEPQAERPAPVVPLERLLKLPPSVAVSAPRPRRSGLTRPEWESRFRKARSELQEARESLARVQKELEETAADVSSWQMAPPGQQVSRENSPISYRLTQEIRRRREEVRASERRLQELIVEANLAGVPDEWRGE